MMEDEYIDGLHPIPTTLPEDEPQPFQPRLSSVDSRELAAIRAEVQRLQREADAAMQELLNRRPAVNHRYRDEAQRVRNALDLVQRAMRR